MKAQRLAKRRTCVYAIRYEAVIVRIQVQRTPKALDQRDCAALTVGLANAPFHPIKQGIEEQTKHGARQFGVVGDLEAQREGQGQHPLPDRHCREHIVGQVCAKDGHPTAPARGAHGATLSAEAHELLLATARATHSGEAVGQDATLEVVVELMRPLETAVGVSIAAGELLSDLFDDYAAPLGEALPDIELNDAFRFDDLDLFGVEPLPAPEPDTPFASLLERLRRRFWTSDAVGD